MTSRFPGAAQSPTTPKPHLDHNFNHMIEVARKGTGIGQLNDPKTIAIDPNTMRYMSYNPILSVYYQFFRSC